MTILDVAVLGGTGVKIGNVFLKKLGSDLIVQSSRQSYPAQNFPLYHLGMVPGGKVFMGGRLGGIFVFLYFRIFGTVFLKKLGSGLGLRSSR